jgi:hypothetical protein
MSKLTLGSVLGHAPLVMVDVKVGLAFTATVAVAVALQLGVLPSLTVTV